MIRNTGSNREVACDSSQNPLPPVRMPIVRLGLDFSGSLFIEEDCWDYESKR